MKNNISTIQTNVDGLSSESLVSITTLNDSITAIQTDVTGLSAETLSSVTTLNDSITAIQTDVAAISGASGGGGSSLTEGPQFIPDYSVHITIPALSANSTEILDFDLGNIGNPSSLFWVIQYYNYGDITDMTLNEIQYWAGYYPIGILPTIEYNTFDPATIIVAKDRILYNFSDKIFKAHESYLLAERFTHHSYVSNPMKEAYTDDAGNVSASAPLTTGPFTYQNDTNGVMVGFYAQSSKCCLNIFGNFDVQINAWWLEQSGDNTTFRMSVKNNSETATNELTSYNIGLLV